jgi:hypothetical protein
LVVVGGVLGSLEGELDVEEGGEGLDGAVVLGVVEEVADAGLEVGVPIEYVELAVEEGLEGEGGGLMLHWGRDPRGVRVRDGYLLFLKGVVTRSGSCHGCEDEDGTPVTGKVSWSRSRICLRLGKPAGSGTTADKRSIGSVLQFRGA